MRGSVHYRMDMRPAAYALGYSWDAKKHRRSYKGGIVTTNTTQSTQARKSAPSLDLPVPGIGFQGASSRLLKKWRVFSGRASRSEYWWAVLYVCLIDALFVVMEYFFESFAIAVYGWWLFVLVPMLALSVRRLHDADMTGWWAPVPYVCGVVGACVAVSPVVKVIIALGITDPMQFVGAAAKGVLQQFGGGAVAPALIGLLLMVAAVVLQIVLFARPGKPEGVRFDGNDNPASKA